MKSKEDIKILMLHIMGLVVHLSATGNINLSFIAAILKKQVSELKTYCQELGMIIEQKKTKTESGDIDDFRVSFNKKKADELPEETKDA
jgi:hypothetical protein